MRQITAFEANDGSLHRLQEQATERDRTIARHREIKEIADLVDDYVVEHGFRFLSKVDLSADDQALFCHEIAEFMIKEWESLASKMEKKP